MTSQEAAREADEPADRNAAARPQSLMLSFFGTHVLGRGVALSSGTVIDVFARVGVGEEAVRSTLTRMVGRGLLERHRRGRKMYFALTPRAEAVLADGHDRIHRRGAVNRAWDGTWTLVGFTLPEAWRRERHDLRQRLVWAGFGPLQGGLWVAPRAVDVTALVAELGLEEHVNVFQGAAVGPTRVDEVLRTAFDIEAIASGYRAFAERWADGPPAPSGSASGGAGGGAGEGAGEPGDDLTRRLLLHTDWLGVVRADPHLPAGHLPPDWPAARAEELFRELERRYAEGAERIAADTFDRIELAGRTVDGTSGRALMST